MWWWFWFPSLNDQVLIQCVSSWRGSHWCKSSGNPTLMCPNTFSLRKRSRGSQVLVRIELLVFIGAQSKLLHLVLLHFHTVLWWGTHSPCLITWLGCGCSLGVPCVFLWVILSSEGSWFRWSGFHGRRVDTVLWTHPSCYFQGERNVLVLNTHWNWFLLKKLHLKTPEFLPFPSWILNNFK